MAATPRARGLSRAKRVYFRVLAILLAFGFLASVELVTRLVSPSDPDPYVSISSFTLFSRFERSGTPYLRITHPFAYPDRQVAFPLAKPPGGVRIFCLGGSASAGWPHPPEEIYSAYLESMLRRALPGRSVEVINASAHGFPSYRVRRIFDQVVSLSPDAIIVYSGNNEFLEERSYRKERASALVAALSRHLKSFALLHDWVLSRRQRLSGAQLNDLAAAMWQKVQQQASQLRADPQQLTGVEAHYAASIEHMVESGAAHHVPVLLLTVPSNLRDWLPTVSFDPLKGDALRRWQARYREGRRTLTESDPAAAKRAFEAALALAPQHAATWFWLGRAREQGHDRGGAYAAYLRAKDLDYNPFRALSNFNRTLRSLAREHPREATLVDLEARFRATTPLPAPGFDLFLDYVHPTVAGNRLIADTVFSALSAHRVLGMALPPTQLPPPSAYAEARDFHLLMKIFGMCTMNHQYAAAVARAQQIEELVAHPPAGAAGKSVPKTVPPVVSQAREVFTAYLELDYLQLVGKAPPPPAPRKIQAALDAFYARWFQYGKF